MKKCRLWCFDCPLKPNVIDGVSYCPEPAVKDRPANCPENQAPKATSRIMAWLLVGIMLAGSFTLGFYVDYFQGKTEPAAPAPALDTGIALYKQVTVARPSYLSEADIEALINSNIKYKAMRGKGIGAACSAVEKKYGIGADVMFALVCHESGCGTGNFVQNPTYGTLNNYISLGVYEGSPTKYKAWATPTDNIMEGGELLRNSYLNPADWRYKGGLLEDIAVYYVGGDKQDDVTWYTGIYSYMNNLDTWCKTRYSAYEWELILAKRKTVGARILQPSSTIENYWGRPISREEMVIILERIGNQK